MNIAGFGNLFACYCAFDPVGGRWHGSKVSYFFFVSLCPCWDARFDSWSSPRLTPASFQVWCFCDLRERASWSTALQGLFLCSGAMLPLMLVLGCSALLPEVSGSLVGAKIPAVGLKLFSSTIKTTFVQLVSAVTVVQRKAPGSIMGQHKALFGLVLLASTISPVGATCPTCFGYTVGCTFDANKRCPAIEEPSSNRNIIAGTGAGPISLAKCILPRFLRMFTRAEISTVQTIASRPPPGTAVVVTATTKLKDICIYLDQGLVSMEQINIMFAGFVDDEADADKRKALMDNLKLLSSMKDSRGASGAHMDAGEPYGVLTWLLAMVCSFVAAGTLVSKTTLGPADASASAGSSTARHLAKLVRPKAMVDFFEVLNLYIMFYSSLGLGSTIMITQFIQFAVFDTIRIRKREWPVAFELMVVLMRKVENSPSELNIGNIISEVYLNSAMEEATEAAKHYYAVFFRGRAGDAQPGLGNDKGAEKEAKWNNKFNHDKDAKPCAAFNNGAAHNAFQLKADGSCRFGHVCDHWVSDKGPGGKCLGSAGTKGHTRDACDNPNRSDSKLE